MAQSAGAGEWQESVQESDMRIWILSFLLLAGPIWAETQLLPGEPIVEARDCILRIVAQRMEVTLRPEIPAPTIRPQGLTSLKEFQDSMDLWWHFRPDFFTNAYNPLRHEIFIMTEADYYQKFERSVFDSLAHELTHFLQEKYKGADISQGDDALELDAIDMQTWFREAYKAQFQNNHFICPL